MYPLIDSLRRDSLLVVPPIRKDRFPGFCLHNLRGGSIPLGDLNGFRINIGYWLWSDLML